MTLSVLRNEIWQQLGEPFDLDPATDTQYAGRPLLNWVVSEGQRQVASWKDPVTHFLFRHRSLVGKLNFKSKVIEGILEATGGTSTITFGENVLGSQDDRYIDWIVRVGSDTRLIVDYQGISRMATVHKDWTTPPAIGDSFSLYKRFYWILPASDAWATGPEGEHISVPEGIDISRYRPAAGYLVPLQIIDLPQGRPLGRSPKGENYGGSLLSPGAPGEWFSEGNSVTFNCPNSDERWYQMKYYRIPVDLVNDDQEPELPDHLHFGIILWGCWWGFLRQRENAEAYSRARYLEDFMRSRISAEDVAYEKEDDFGSLQLEEL